MITDFKIFEDLLTPTDSYTSFNAIKKYKNQKDVYIHYTELNKLGVNPQKGHHDPFGIYFYPLKFMFGEDYTIFQYGFSMKYYYICKIDTKNFLKINNITFSDIERFFKLAGLINIFNNINFGDINKRNDKKLWEVLDMLVVEPKLRKSYNNLPQIRWNAFFSKIGYDGIIDNKGVINMNEPEQVLVFNQKTITILEHGENKIEKNIYQKFFDELKNKINPDYFDGKYKTIKDSTIYMIKTKKNNSSINIEINLSNNNIVFFYICNDLLKTKKIRINIFGELKQSVIYSISNTYERCLNDSDKNKNIEDYTDEKFNTMLQNIFNYIKPESIQYETDKISYYDIDNCYLKFIYHKKSLTYLIEYYPFEGVESIFFKFEFENFEDFRIKLRNQISELKNKNIINHLIKFSLFDKNLLKIFEDKFTDKKEVDVILNGGLSGKFWSSNRDYQGDYTKTGKSVFTNLKESLADDKLNLIGRLESYIDYYKNKGNDVFVDTIKQILVNINKDDLTTAFHIFADSDLKYDIGNTYELLRDLKTETIVQTKFGSNWGETAGTYEVWRAGNVENQENGIFFSIDESGASFYADEDHPVKKYIVDIKNPLVARRVEDAFSFLTGKSKEQTLKIKDNKNDLGGYFLDIKVAYHAKKKGYDSILYTKPAPPCFRELVLLNNKNIIKSF